ncbi:hypothetical protein AVEN_64735-1 [Araneus ventricosus]|uniref:Uncharacterized protein n=1 Tax=Araneus ventricosus TaxID=182803 RepID=A0A4Y2PF01_ARAVE|nr:hypothetical protein AVEN_64735-1 [Araneus ventricosus]
MEQSPAHPQYLPAFNNTKVVFFFCKLHEKDSIFGSECHSLCESAVQKNFNPSTSGCVTQLREIRDISAEINGGEEGEVEDNDDEKDAAKVSPTHTVALEALEILRDYFQFNSGSEGTFSRLDELEKTLFKIDGNRNNLRL